MSLFNDLSCDTIDLLNQKKKRISRVLHVINFHNLKNVG